MWQNSNLVACCLQYFCSVNIASSAVLSIHDNKIPEVLPPESGRFFVKREAAIQWFSQWRYHRQIPNVVIAIFQCRHGIECLNDTMRYILCPANTDMRKDPSRDNFIYRLPRMVDW